MVLSNNSSQSIPTTQEEHSQEALPVIEEEETLTSLGVTMVEEQQSEEDLTVTEEEEMLTSLGVTMVEEQESEEDLTGMEEEETLTSPSLTMVEEQQSEEDLTVIEGEDLTSSSLTMVEEQQSEEDLTVIEGEDLTSSSLTMVEEQQSEEDLTVIEEEETLTSLGVTMVEEQQSEEDPTVTEEEETLTSPSLTMVEEQQSEEDPTVIEEEETLTSLSLTMVEEQQSEEDLTVIEGEDLTSSSLTMVEEQQSEEDLTVIEGEDLTSSSLTMVEEQQSEEDLTVIEEEETLTSLGVTMVEEQQSEEDPTVTEEEETLTSPSLTMVEEQQSEEDPTVIEEEETLTSLSLTMVEEQQSEEDLTGIDGGSGQKEDDMGDEVTIVMPRITWSKDRLTTEIPSAGLNSKRGYHSEVNHHVQKEETLTSLPISPSKSLKPFAKHQRLFRIVSILLALLLVFALTRLSMNLSAADNQLLIGIGNQGAATVDLRQSLPISPYLFGTNVFPETNTSSVDQGYNGFMSYGQPITSGLQNTHIKLLRFPGGVWGEDHVLSYDQLNAFSTLLSQVGAEGMIQAHLSGSVVGGGPDMATLENRANLAGNWVNYMNDSHSRLRTGQYAHAPFHPIKFWTVGNEPDYHVNSDTGKPFTVAEYINDFIQFSKMMHQNNPTIQVFGPEISQFYGVGAGPTDPNGQLWMETFLKGVGAYEKAHPELKFHLLDGVSFHFYPFSNVGMNSAALMSNANEWNYLLPPLHQTIEQDLGRDAPIAITEINSTPTQQVPSPGIAALWWADTLGTFMDQEVADVAFFATEGVDKPYPLFTTNGLSQTPMFRVMQLFSHLQHNLVPVEVQRDPISVYATQDDTYQTVSLLFVNKSATTQLAQVSPQDRFFGVSAWHNLDISLYHYSITVVTLHRDGRAEAYSYKVPDVGDTNVAPLIHTICGHKTDALANATPC